MTALVPAVLICVSFSFRTTQVFLRRLFDIPTSGRASDISAVEYADVTVPPIPDLNAN
jgi:hypothetical protein